MYSGDILLVWFVVLLDVVLVCGLGGIVDFVDFCVGLFGEWCVEFFVFLVFGVYDCDEFCCGVGVD